MDICMKSFFHEYHDYFVMLQIWLWWISWLCCNHPNSYYLFKSTESEIGFKVKDNSTMYKTEAQIVVYGILNLNPSSHQCQPSYKKYIAVQTPPNRHKIEALGAAILAS